MRESLELFFKVLHIEPLKTHIYSSTYLENVIFYIFFTFEGLYMEEFSRQSFDKYLKKMEF